MNSKDREGMWSVGILRESKTFPISGRKLLYLTANMDPEPVINSDNTTQSLSKSPGGRSNPRTDSHPNHQGVESSREGDLNSDVDSKRDLDSSRKLYLSPLAEDVSLDVHVTKIN